MSGAALYEMVEAVKPYTRGKTKTSMYVVTDYLPRGCVIATAELVGCWEIAADPKGPFLCVEWDFRNGDHELIVKGNELLFGDFTPGRYAWEFSNMKMLDDPIPAKGAQKIWEWNDNHGT